MSMPPAPFPFHIDKHDPISIFTSPSPPTASPSDCGVDFDIEAFTNCSPGTTLFDDVSGLSPVASNTPSSTTLVSPKLSATDIGVLFPINGSNDADAAEALSNHHLERFIHYKGLAAQAEVDARVQQNEQIDLLLASCSMPDDSLKDTEPGYQYQPTSYCQPVWESSFAFLPQQSAVQAHAQAEVYTQAHDAVLAYARQPRFMMDYYMSPATFDPAPQTIWSRQSVSTQCSSPPFPSTPTPTPPIMAIPMARPASLSFASAPTSPVVEDETEADANGLNESSHFTSEDIKPVIDNAILNHGDDGRGYVPGKTPEDPSKRHNCQVCGRGFARAFNLKSHVQTHNPSRLKPHQCPHPTCKRGFSRLHDLERHRQGIHSDGPLVAAKRQGVAPSVARAQSRIQRRAESGSLI